MSAPPTPGPPTPGPPDPNGLIDGRIDVPTCLQLLKPGERCPANLRVPPGRTGPIVAAATAVLLTGAGVLAAAIGALVTRLRRRRS